MPNTRPLILIVLDGWGFHEQNENNAITLAKKPIWDQLWSNYPHTLLSGSGLDVGLPAGQMGNSEVGHMTLGSGRVIYQDLTLINNSITDKSFFTNQILLNALQQATDQNKAVHILGLLSPGGVHSHEHQIFALIKMAAAQQATQVYVHVFLDGRDVPPKSASASLYALEQICATYPNTKIASIMGRFYAMDRDKRTERTMAAFDLLAHGKSDFAADNALAGLEIAYARGETDEFVQPTKIINTQIQNGDVVIFMNFRSDRARQLSHALSGNLQLGDFVTLTEYDPALKAHVAFAKPEVQNTLGEVLQRHKLRQLRIAETEKYAHVTFFFNAGKEQQMANEDRVLIPSPKVATYDLTPDMAAPEICTQLITAIQNKTYDVIICNFANADMLGHTGNLPATIQAIQTLDNCLGKIYAAIQEYGGEVLITADHGNAEVMWDEISHQPHTAHTSNLVPLIFISARKFKFKDPAPGQIFGLKDIAPTMLALLDLEVPAEMTGSNLLEIRPMI